MKRCLWRVFAALTLVAAVGGTTTAGPILLDGTDADDHGSGNNVTNSQGWFYIQRGLQSLVPQVSNGNGTSIVVLGGTGGDAHASVTSASIVAGYGTPTFITSAADIGTFLSGGLVSGASLGTTALLYVPSDGASGAITSAQIAALTANAAAINNFVNGGGGLFSLGHSYNWLAALLPGIVIDSNGGDGLTLTAAGQSAFPGLTNADLSAGPWHYSFSGNIGGLSVLFTGDGGEFVGIGGGAGTSITGESTPEPATLAVLGLMAAGGGFYVRRRRNVAVA